MTGGLEASASSAVVAFSSFVPETAVSVATSFFSGFFVGFRRGRDLFWGGAGLSRQTPPFFLPGRPESPAVVPSRFPLRLFFQSPASGLFELFFPVRAAFRLPVALELLGAGCR